MLAKAGFDSLAIKNGAPFCLKGTNIRSTAGGDFAKQLTESTKDRHQYDIAGAKEGNENRFNARAGGSIDQHGRFVVGFKYLPIKFLGFPHHVAKHRVVLTQHGGRHGAEDTWIGIDGPGAHQQTWRRIDRKWHIDGVRTRLT